jgi:hypothetical protein
MTASLQERIKQSDSGRLASRLHQPWRLALALLCYLLIAVAVLEGFFRIAGVGQQEFLQPDLQLGCRHIPNKTVTWRLEGYSCDRLNSAGLRDSEHSITKAPGVFRIALLGDSATESLQVNLAETYGKVLQSMLNNQIAGKHVRLSNRLINSFEVINFGCSSYSSGQELLQYRTEVLKYDPDAVVLLFNRGDTAENVLNRSAADAPEPRPYFYLDEQRALETDNTVLQANFDKLRPNPFLDFLRAQSRIYGVFSQTHLSLSLTDSRYRKLRSWFERFGSAISGMHMRRTSKLAYPQQDGLPVTVSLMKALADEVGKHHQTFVLMIFPNMVHDPYFASQISSLKGLSESEHFCYLDLAPAFLSTKEPLDNFLWYHFSPAGHKLVAKSLFDLIRSQFFQNFNCGKQVGRG